MPKPLTNKQIFAASPAIPCTVCESRLRPTKADYWAFLPGPGWQPLCVYHAEVYRASDVKLITADKPTEEPK